MCEAASLDVIGSAHSMPPSGRLMVLPMVKASKSPNPCRSHRRKAVIRCCPASLR